MSPSELQDLLDQYMAETISAADHQRLWETLQQPAYAEQWHRLIADTWYNNNLHPLIDPQRAAVLGRLKELVAAERPVPRVHFMRRWGWVAAAAVILLAIAGIYLRPQRITPVQTAQVINIAPGKEGAILTLADGSQMVLDSLQNGVVATQNGADVRLQNGQLAYDDHKENTSDMVLYNTMSTPRGRQFRITLPDGTGVWLNSASSIRYPTTFTGKERKVDITGEVYFEVVKDAGKPFRVNANNKTVINVLGTNFNVNAYSNEKSLNTTLLEGSVKIMDVVLKPGQQAQLNGSIQVSNDVDLEKVMAWKNGAFNFDNVNVAEAMRQLERWYNIEVVYENGIPDIRFFGKISRNVPLASLLKMLSGADLRFRMENGRKLVITK